MTTKRTKPRSLPRTTLPGGPMALLVADAIEQRVLEPLLRAAKLSVTWRRTDVDAFDLEEFLLDLEDTIAGPSGHITAAVIVADRLIDARIDIISLVDDLLPADRPLLVSCTQAGATEQAALCRHPRRLVGFSVLGLLGGHQVVEVAPALRSETDLVRRVSEWFALAGVQAPQVQDSPGLVLARVLAPLVNEAALATGEGIAPPEAIDTAMQLGGDFPFGPLRWADQVGLDRILMILDYLSRTVDSERYRPAPLLQQLALSGFTGKAVGRGFFSYEQPAPSPMRRLK